MQVQIKKSNYPSFAIFMLYELMTHTNVSTFIILHRAYLMYPPITYWIDQNRFPQWYNVSIDKWAHGGAYYFNDVSSFDIDVGLGFP